MEVNCEGCAGCCIDWRAIAPDPSDHERRGSRRPLDDAYNFVPLNRDDIYEFLDAGLADALTPRLWHDESGVEIDGVPLAAIDERPAFFLGLRKATKPVGPFGTDSTWLPTCAFLDPTTLQCRIHDADAYPSECAEYPGHNLELEQKTECERVEEAFDGTDGAGSDGRERLIDDTPPEELSALLLGPQALGQKVFVFPDVERLSGVVERATADELTDEDRALFVAAAASATPGTPEVNRERFDDAFERGLEAESWVGESVDDWTTRAGEVGSDAPDPSVAEAVEVIRGAPETPGWDG